ncbi:MAG: FYDLN acid domain-containing protein [Pseudomonadota bacterium]
MDEDLGIKRKCLECGALFYDLGKPVIYCPACGALHDPNAAMRLKRTHVKEEGSEETKTSSKHDVELGIDQGNDETMLEDTSELDDTSIPAEVVVPEDHDEKDG